MLWLLRKSSLFSGGWGGGGGLLHSILFQGCNHKGYNLDPLPPQKNIYIYRIINKEWENGAFWPSCTGFNLDFATAWGLGVFHLLQDCRPKPENAAQYEKYKQCLFLSFKGTRD